MNLPNYQLITLKTSSFEELESILKRDINSSRAIGIVLSELDLEDQKEVAALIENYFSTQDISYFFPYPVYIISDIPQSLSNMLIISDKKNLPNFFKQKESKPNTKENQILTRNKLLQQEIRNLNMSKIQVGLSTYASGHKELYQLTKEESFYLEIKRSLSGR